MVLTIRSIRPRPPRCSFDAKIVYANIENIKDGQSVYINSEYGQIDDNDNDDIVDKDNDVDDIKVDMSNLTMNIDEHIRERNQKFKDYYLKSFSSPRSCCNPKDSIFLQWRSTTPALSSSFEASFFHHPQKLEAQQKKGEFRDKKLSLKKQPRKHEADRQEINNK
ncbi:hypothetical protein L1887_05282 [Cichorium endivia]|nr:hypothetical protein L1887_05282 [Cichorium endivia]